MSNSMSDTPITRRSLIAGTAAAASTIAFMKEAVLAGADETPKTGADYKAAPTPIDDADVAETVEADVVVVGLGNAGVVAAVTAAEEGAKVFCFQKADTPYTFGTGVAFPNTTALAVAGIQNDAWDIVNTIQRSLNENHGKTVMWRNWVNYGEEVGNWWCKLMDENPELGPSMGIPFPAPDDDNASTSVTTPHTSRRGRLRLAASRSSASRTTSMTMPSRTAPTSRHVSRRPPCNLRSRTAG